MDIFYHPFERVFLIGTNNDCENDDDSETDCIFSTVSRERGSLCKMPLTPTQGSNASLGMHQMLCIQIYKYRIKYKKIYTHTCIGLILLSDIMFRKLGDNIPNVWIFT